MTTPPNFTDDILDLFNWIDRIQAWLTFLLKNRRTLEFRMTFNDEHSLNDVIAHLGKHGVLAVRSGFGSKQMRYVISFQQKQWHDYLVLYDKDGAPVLRSSKTRWMASGKKARKARKPWKIL